MCCTCETGSRPDGYFSSSNLLPWIILSCENLKKLHVHEAVATKIPQWFAIKIGRNCNIQAHHVSTWLFEIPFCSMIRPCSMIFLPYCRALNILPFSCTEYLALLVPWDFFSCQELLYQIVPLLVPRFFFNFCTRVVLHAIFAPK